MPSRKWFLYSSLRLLLLLLSRFSRVRLCVTQWTAAHQAPPSLGFSRQEHWSGLPFPSPVHECEKWKWSRSALADSSRPHGLQPTRLLHPWDFPGKSTGVGCHSGKTTFYIFLCGGKLGAVILPTFYRSISTTEHILVPYRHNSMWFNDVQLIAVYILSYYLYILHII